MFSHVFKYRLKTLLRKRVVIFWTLIFPIVLSTFFQLAFSNLSKMEKLETMEIAVVETKASERNQAFVSVIDSLSKENKNQLFHTKKVKQEKEAQSLLKDNQIIGYYILGDDIEIIVKTNGIGETIMKTVADEFMGQISMTQHIASVNPSALASGVLEGVNQEKQYLQEKKTDNVDFSVIYFYTVIGMVCIYGGFFGIDATYDTEANQSTRGARLSVAPTHKMKVLLISLLVGLLIQYSELLILLAYLVFVLGIDFGTQLVPILFLTFVGCIAGVAFGTFIGVCNRKSTNVKTGIFLSATMTCCFLAGMMMLDMRMIIAQNAPIIGYINPVSMITDALYALYYYTTLDRYFFNIISLIIFSVVMMVLSYYFIRRKKYDSI